MVLAVAPAITPSRDGQDRTRVTLGVMKLVLPVLLAIAPASTVAQQAQQTASIMKDSTGNIVLGVPIYGSVIARKAGGSEADVFGMVANQSAMWQLLLGMQQAQQSQQQAQQAQQSQLAAMQARLDRAVQCNTAGMLYNDATGACFTPISNATVAVNQTVQTLQQQLDAAVQCSTSGQLYNANSSTCANAYVDGCRFNNGGCSQGCTPGLRGHQCTCNTGWVLASDGRTCLDRRSCAQSPCHPGVTCTNSPGQVPTFRCGDCPAGTWGDGTNCTTCSACTQGTQYIRSNCTGTANTVCLACSAPCTGGSTRELQSCAANHDRICMPAGYQSGSRVFVSPQATFTVPPGVGTSFLPLRIRMWGGGGGGNNNDHNPQPRTAGSGGYTAVNVTTLPIGTTTLTVRVGQGGGRGRSCRCGGGGGGGSSVRIAGGGNALVAVAGGGGGSDGAQTSLDAGQGGGTVGGGTFGQCNRGCRGSGATQTAPGRGGVNNNGRYSTGRSGSGPNGGHGGSVNRGVAGGGPGGVGDGNGGAGGCWCGDGGGGGGGGGYFGGGGGASDTWGGPGGGGSSYINSQYGRGVLEGGGLGGAPPRTSEPGYITNRARGGRAGQNGGPGLIILQW
mmetsp:Transcript_35165/g.92011  ORF Transcript_35165/g.92011 Transcript_35165/m.92011 type:complete len:617 (+) Transcript_35165:69-1919(+)